MTPSASIAKAVQEANQQLLTMRQALWKQKQAAVGGPTISPVTQPISQAFVNQLPSHLGWGSAAVTQLIRKQKTKAQDFSCPTSPLVENEKPAPPLLEDVRKTRNATKAESGPKDRIKVQPDFVRHYPCLGIGALRTKQVPLYAVWLACRLLDSDGRGWLPVRDLRSRFTDQISPLRLFGRRRLRQVLQQGNGRFWTWDRANDRLWLRGTAPAAVALRVSKLQEQAVMLPVTALTNGMGIFKAHLYGAWHSSKEKTKPISRQTQRSLLHIPERTQRHYESQIGMQVHPNYAVGAAYTAANIEKAAWQRGRALFQFVDKNGRLGPGNGRYIAWQLPNSYEGPHHTGAPGRQRRINRRLIGLVQDGVQGNNEQQQVKRRYFSNGATAAQAISRQQTGEAYWPLTKERRKWIWSVFFVD